MENNDLCALSFLAAQAPFHSVMLCSSFAVFYPSLCTIYPSLPKMMWTGSSTDCVSCCYIFHALHDFANFLRLSDWGIWITYPSTESDLLFLPCVCSVSSWVVKKCILIYLNCSQNRIMICRNYKRRNFLKHFF